MAHVPFLTEVIAFLVATLLIVPLARSLRVSPILDYHAAGILAGSSLLGLVSNVDDVRALHMPFDADQGRAGPMRTSLRQAQRS